jgi:arylsulfatase A-like enzyme
MRADALTGSLAETAALPHLRCLMDDAVTFTNHFSVTCPCGPARTSLLTGQYAMNHRSVRNGTPLPRDKPNLATALCEADIEPLLYGYTDTSPDPRYYASDDPVLTSYEQVMTGFIEAQEMRFENNRVWEAYLKEQGYDLGTGSEVFRPDGASLTSPAHYAAEHSDTAFLTDRLLDDLPTRTGNWCALATFVRPHPPYIAPAPYNSLLDPASMPPAIQAINDAARHPFDGPARSFRQISDMVVGFDDLAHNPENTAMIRAVYMGLITELDHHIGRIMSWLKETGQYDETIIIFTADHAEMLGDYGYWGKMHYHDAAFRIPLVIKQARHPQTQCGLRVERPTESIDVVPTILDMLGLDVPDSMDGTPLAPLLQGKDPSDWKQATMSELDFGDPVTPTIWQHQLGLSSRQCSLAVFRSKDETLVHFGGGLPQIMFDHTAEGEAVNLAENKKFAQKQKALTAALLSHRMTHTEGQFAHTMITEEGVMRGDF